MLRHHILTPQQVRPRSTLLVHDGCMTAEG